MADHKSEELQKQLMTLFLVEAQEYLETINSHVLSLEESKEAKPGGEKFEEMLRSAHSLKGASRAVNLNDIESRAHQLESLFINIQSGQTTLDRRAFDTIYQSLDKISEQIKKFSGEAVDNDGNKEPDNTQNDIDKSVSSAPLEISQGSQQVDRSVNNKKNVTDVGKGIRRKKSATETPGALDKKQPPKLKQASLPQKSIKPTPRTSNTENDLTGQRKQQTASKETAVEDIKGKAPAKNANRQNTNLPESSAHIVEETLRVSTKRLDTLLSKVGELQVSRIASEQRRNQLLQLQEQVSMWELEWRKVRTLYHRLLLKAEHLIHPEEPVSTGLTENKFSELNTVLEFIKVNETRLAQLRNLLSDLHDGVKADNRRMEQLTADLEDDVHAVRLQPVSTVYTGLPRMVRDLSKEKNKEVQLILEGGDIHVDRSVLEMIKDPLIHLLRNSIDHGIEDSQSRKELGKLSQGTIMITATQQGDSLLLDVMDDGAGVDIGQVKKEAVAKGIITAESASELSDKDALWLIFHSGLSTSKVITDISGRGIGLDVVRDRVERLHGQIDVSSVKGRGSHFILKVPLSITTTHCLLVKAGFSTVGRQDISATYAIPLVNVEHLLYLSQDEIGSTKGERVIYLDDEPVVLVSLAQVLGTVTSQPDVHQEKITVLIIGDGQRKISFLVDQVLGVQELVVKNLPKPFVKIQNISSASILSDGEVAIVLNAADLLRSAESQGVLNMDLSQAKSDMEVEKPVIMVVDDSITTRTLVKNILEASGYEVRTASDGIDAWERLQDSHCDLLVSDIKMPRMNGFELTKKVRSDDVLKILPVILVTSLDSAKDREEGISSGADAYIVKSAFDQEVLLTTIKRLV